MIFKLRFKDVYGIDHLALPFRLHLMSSRVPFQKDLHPLPPQLSHEFPKQTQADLVYSSDLDLDSPQPRDVGGIRVSECALKSCSEGDLWKDKGYYEFYHSWAVVAQYVENPSVSLQWLFYYAKCFESRLPSSPGLISAVKLEIVWKK
ncbi:hypothetical protein PoB_002107100 [Plakobranchus ocellatus]|uniref:Uncharacterized protein n=1 Tax=Plakobranchus ocellatus TaxID=259542 RepID=A0AAV3Z5H7_9GAST|nr:hypothetical protein PoB_002107100 [Plakobranchus ocellatus]